MFMHTDKSKITIEITTIENGSMDQAMDPIRMLRRIATALVKYITKQS